MNNHLNKQSQVTAPQGEQCDGIFKESTVTSPSQKKQEGGVAPESDKETENLFFVMKTKTHNRNAVRQKIGTTETAGIPAAQKLVTKENENAWNSVKTLADYVNDRERGLK